MDRYCYFVAGTVGHLLTELFRLQRPSMAPERYRRLSDLATSFGRGLQLTNIIKDVSDDRRRGWSFVPRQLCELVGVRPEDLQSERHRDAGRRVMLALIAKAKGHLVDAPGVQHHPPARGVRHPPVLPDVALLRRADPAPGGTGRPPPGPRAQGEDLAGSGAADAGRHAGGGTQQRARAGVLSAARRRRLATRQRARGALTSGGTRPPQELLGPATDP